MKLAGTLPEFNKDTLLKFFRGVYLTKAKDTISSYFGLREITMKDKTSSHVKKTI